MTYYILTDIHTRFPQIYCDSQGHAREFKTYKAAADYITEWTLENADVVALCSEKRNYLV